MKGKYNIKISTNRVTYEFTIYRNITILRGDSSAGKSFLYKIIEMYNEDNKVANIESKIPLITFPKSNWKSRNIDINNSLIIVDEPDYLQDAEFIDFMKNSGNYFLIISRYRLDRIPYSIEEVYELCKSGKYISFKRVYEQLKQQISIDKLLSFDKIIIEDSKSGFDFFKSVLSTEKCITAYGKSRIIDLLSDDSKEYFIIADGSAFGSEIDRIYDYKKNFKINFLIEESFEYVILNSDILKLKEIRDIVENPYDYIDCIEWFSWEQYFTNLLTSSTRNMERYKWYKKSSLSSWYLNKLNREKILKSYGIVDENQLTWV